MRSSMLMRSLCASIFYQFKSDFLASYTTKIENLIQNLIIFDNSHAEVHPVLPSVLCTVE